MAPLDAGKEENRVRGLNAACVLRDVVSYHPDMPVFLRWIVYLIPLNPIAVRLVQNGSRRTRHLYIRAAYPAVLILVLLS